MGIRFRWHNNKKMTKAVERFMREVLLALIAGVIVGIVFKFIKLPLPAPPVLPGVIGIVGVYLGGVAGSWIMQQFFKG